MTSPAPYIPYQPYKSKRHGRNTSNQSPPSGAASPRPRPQSMVSNGHMSSEPIFHQRAESLTSADAPMRRGPSPVERAAMTRPVSMFDTLPTNGHDRADSTIFTYPVKSPSISSHPANGHSQSPSPAPSIASPSPTTVHHPSLVSAPTMSAGKPPTITVNGSNEKPPIISPSLSPAPSPAVTLFTPPNSAASSSSQPVAGPSSAVSPTSPRKTSTFRRVPLRSPNTRTVLPSSPLRPADTHSRTPSLASTQSRQLEPPPPIAHTPSQASSGTPSPSVVTAYERALPPVPSLDLGFRPLSSPEDTVTHTPKTPTSPSSATPLHVHSLGPSPKPQTRVLSPAPGPSATEPSSPAVALHHARERSAPRSPAPYRPGFQPKGVYRPRTDEFIEARKASRDVGRIERTRLERRLEKLIHLHFPSESQKLKEKPEQRPAPRPNKRLSSIFEMDFSELRSKSASDLWREVLQPQITPGGGKNDIRAAEQTITPWEDDASVTQCPLCKSAFHPLTNRKHHCRLCGRIICSLPVKVPQRPEPCSLLFVADSKTGRIEEVSEGVDYGVRRRPSGNPQAKGRKEEAMGEDEKFLKGVRICRDCRPVLLREQYKHEARSIPIFFKLYDAFISLEKEIEDALPQFQELMLSLSNHERPTPEASAARKRLLEAFGQYDALAKRIRQLPTPGGPGGSQDRIQAAIAARANQFLQKNMFPLQSLPKATHGMKTSPSTSSTPEEPQIDPESELARTLQPLLEQEALLESFVEEAKAHRKFEDAKTLKTSLQEIRAEINRIVANADASVAGNSRRGTSRKRS